MGSKSAWRSSQTSHIVLSSLAVLVLLAVVSVAGYRVARQRFVSLHQDQSQTVRTEFIVIRLGVSNWWRTFSFSNFSKFPICWLERYLEPKKIFSRLPWGPWCRPPLAVPHLPTPLTTCLTTPTTTVTGTCTQTKTAAKLTLAAKWCLVWSVLVDVMTRLGQVRPEGSPSQSDGNYYEEYEGPQSLNGLLILQFSAIKILFKNWFSIKWIDDQLCYSLSNTGAEILILGTAWCNLCCDLL